MCYQQWCSERPAEGNITSLGCKFLRITIAIWASPGCESVRFGVQWMCTSHTGCSGRASSATILFLWDGGCLQCMHFLWTWSGCDHHYLCVTMKMKWSHSLCQRQPNDEISAHWGAACWTLWKSGDFPFVTGEVGSFWMLWTPDFIAWWVVHFITRIYRNFSKSTLKLQSNAGKKKIATALQKWFRICTKTFSCWAGFCSHKYPPSYISFPCQRKKMLLQDVINIKHVCKKKKIKKTSQLPCVYF